MNKITPQAILELLLDIQEKKIGQVFFNYYGHTDSVTYSIYLNKWKEDKDPDYSGCIYLLGKLFDREEINKVISLLNDINNGIIEK
jgi:hypothetical protein